MKKHILTTLILIAGVLLAFSARPVKWNTETFDFGTFQESDGPQKGTFKFVNTLSAPVSILKVKTSCGCTSADYTNKIIQPGDSAVVTFSYDPTRRPGRFEKSIKVYFNQSPLFDYKQPEVLTIKGSVIASDETLANDYPIAVGPLRLTSRLVNLGTLRQGVSRHGFIQLYNTSLDSIQPSYKVNDKGLKVSTIPEKIAPGEGGIISIYFTSAATRQTGDLRMSPYINITLPDGSQTEEVLGVWALVEPEDGSTPVDATEGTLTDSDASEEATPGLAPEKKKKSLFPSSYTERKSLKKEEKKEKRKLFSSKYTEKKKEKKKRKLFSNKYTEQKTTEKP